MVLAPATITFAGPPFPPGIPGIPVPKIPKPRIRIKPPVPAPVPAIPAPRVSRGVGVPVPAPAPSVGVPVPAPQIVVPAPTRVVRHSLPAHAVALHIAGAAFFYHLGKYYQKTHKGYVTVAAPIGATVPTLPAGCSSLHIGSNLYFNCSNVFYEPVPNGFIVVNNPQPQTTYSHKIAKAGDKVRIKVETLNVRSGPGKRFQVVDQLYRGQVVEVGGNDGTWYYVQLPDGSYGWIMSKYTKLKRSGYNTNNSRG